MGDKTPLKKVEDSILEDLECSICFEIRPLKILPCSYGHSFCAQCINQIEGKQRCPLCRQNVTLPREGAQALPDDVKKEDLIDLLQWVQAHMNVECVLCGFEGNHMALKLYKYCQDERIHMCQDCRRRFKRRSGKATTVFRSSTLRTTRPRTTTDTRSSTLLRVKSKLLRRISQDPDSASPRTRPRRSSSSSRFPETRPMSAPEQRLPLVNSEDTTQAASTTRTATLPETQTSPAPDQSSFSRSRHGSSHSFCELIANLYSQWSVGTFERANGVVFVGEDRIIVSDWYGERLNKYDVTSGTLVKSRSLKSSFSCLVRESGHGPWDLNYYNPMDKILVTETGSSSLRVVSPDNLDTQKKRLNLNGVQQPVGLGSLKNGHIVISEANFGGLHHIRVHDVHGTCLRQWDSSGRSGSPLFLTVDRHDRIIVSEHSNNCVKIFDIAGRQLGCYGDADSLAKPCGVAVDYMGRILVVHETPRGHQVAVLSSDCSRQVDTLAQSDRSLMNLTDAHMWDLKNVAVHRSMVALVGKEGLHMCKFGSFH